MRLLAAAALAATMAFAPALGSAQGKQDFTLINKTGFTLDEVYVSASNTDDWEEDVLGRDTLANGQRVEISFPRGEKACMHDLKVVYDDGEEAEWDGLNLCEVSTVAISYNRKTGETWAEYD
jgi:hypothetical protein